MIGLAFLICQLAANPALQPRVDVLKTHMPGLEAIEVPADLQAAKDDAVEDLHEKLNAGVDTEAQFNALYEAIDKLRYWLWENATDRPRTAEGHFDESSAAWIIDNGPLHVTIDRRTLAMSVITEKAIWRFGPSAEDDIRGKDKTFSLASAQKIGVQEFRTGYSMGMTMSLTDFPEAKDLTFYITWYLIKNEMVLDIVCNDDAFHVDKLRWPRSFQQEATSDWVTVVPRMQGTLIPGDWHQKIQYEDVSSSRTLYMPWWGVLQGKAGAMAILETPDDGGAFYLHEPGNATIIEPSWFSDLGRFSYPRTIRYVFDDDATYVSMAKRYRQFVKEMGRFVTLREKELRTPLLEKVIGSPIFIAPVLYHTVPNTLIYNKETVEANHTLVPFSATAARLRAAHERGLDQLYVHLDGWGFYGYDNGHPDIIPPSPEAGGWEGMRELADTCEELGYPLALHDQYRDFFYNAASFDPRMARTDATGQFENYAKWNGGPQTQISPRFAPEYVRRNYDALADNGVKVNGIYIDVFAVGPPEQSFMREHPVSRYDCMRFRREALTLMESRGFIISSEEPTDFLVRTIHLVHHGPYTTETFEGGPGLGISVPLFNLVYHECILLPWSMTERGGWGIPEADPGKLHCLLNAGLPYMDPSGDDNHYAMIREAATLARRVAHEEMVNHEFLDDSLRVQRTTFSDGTTVTVDMEAGTSEIVYGGETQP